MFQLYDKDEENYKFYLENPNLIPEKITSEIYKSFKDKNPLLESGIPFSNIINSNIFCNEFHCPICLEFPLNGISCKKCESIFCYNCINKSLENSIKCPKCRDIFEENKIPRQIRNIFGLLKFKCLFCEKILDIENYEIHVKDCDKNIKYKCKIKNCNFIGNKKDIINHALECSLKIKQCNFCLRNFFSYKFDEHFNQCQKLVVSCLFCKQKVEVYEMKNHFKKCFRVKLNVINVIIIMIELALLFIVFILV